VTLPSEQFQNLTTPGDIADLYANLSQPIPRHSDTALKIIRGILVSNDCGMIAGGFGVSDDATIKSTLHLIRSKHSQNIIMGIQDEDTFLGPYISGINSATIKSSEIYDNPRSGYNAQGIGVWILHKYAHLVMLDS
jgi:hypothetical protein